MASELLKGKNRNRDIREFFPTNRLDVPWNTMKAITLKHNSDITKNRSCIHILQKNKTKLTMKAVRRPAAARRNVGHVVITLCMGQQSLVLFTRLSYRVRWLDGSCLLLKTEMIQAQINSPKP